MEITYRILLGIGALVAFLFAMLVIVTGKGDAMSGGGSVRTTFRGKATIDDFISRLILGLGIAFFAIMIGLDFLSNKMAK